MLVNIILIILVIISGLILSCYNTLIRLSNRIKQSEADIDVLLNQRFDMIPNLIETVKGYSKHESETLENIAKSRSSYNINDTKEMDNEFSKIIALSESYPELKADTSFLNLQANLKEIEDKLAVARTRFNRCIVSYNNKVESIPTNIVAKMFNFKLKEFFKTEENKKENIDVSFDK